jgi:hypothetical protein
VPNISLIRFISPNQGTELHYSHSSVVEYVLLTDEDVEYDFPEELYYDDRNAKAKALAVKIWRVEEDSPHVHSFNQHQSKRNVEILLQEIQIGFQENQSKRQVPILSSLQSYLEGEKQIGEPIHII